MPQPKTQAMKRKAQQHATNIEKRGMVPPTRVRQWLRCETLPPSAAFRVVFWPWPCGAPALRRAAERGPHALCFGMELRQPGMRAARRRPCRVFHGRRLALTQPSPLALSFPPVLLVSRVLACDRRSARRRTRTPWAPSSSDSSSLSSAARVREAGRLRA